MYKTDLVLNLIDSSNFVLEEDLPVFQNIGDCLFEHSVWEHEVEDEQTTWTSFLNAFSPQQLSLKQLEDMFAHKNQTGYELMVQIVEQTKTPTGGPALHNKQRKTPPTTPQMQPPDEPLSARPLNYLKKVLAIKNHQKPIFKKQSLFANIKQTLYKKHSTDLFVDGNIADGILRIENGVDPPVVYTTAIGIREIDEEYKTPEYYRLLKLIRSLPKKHPFHSTKFAFDLFDGRISSLLVWNGDNPNTSLDEKLQEISKELVQDLQDGFFTAVNEDNKKAVLQKHILDWLSSNKDIMLLREEQYIGHKDGFAKHVCIQGWTDPDIDEEKLVKSLLKQGAEIKDNLFDLPFYKSWTELEYGNKLVLKSDEFLLEYVPQSSINMGGKKRVVLNPSNLKERFEKINGLLQEWSVDQNSLLLHKSSFGRETIVDYKQTNLSEANLQSIQNGKILVRENPATQCSESFTRVSAEYLQTEEWTSPVPGRWISKTNRRTVERMNGSLQYLQENYFGKEEWDVSIDLKRNEEAYFYNNQTPLSMLIYTMDPRDSIKSLFTHRIFGEDDLELRQDGEAQILEQYTPHSEKGRFKVTLLDHSEKTVKKVEDLMKQTGIVDTIYKEIPHNLLYQTGQKRANVLHDDYLKGQTIQLPKGKKIMHGMTGVETGKEAAQRLENIISQNGLKSIRDRRHSGISVKSLSPLGDIASGIDAGVSATIVTCPAYGSQFVAFAFKDEILQRKRIWFSDRDFGGGEDRTQKYAEYANNLQAGTHDFRQGLNHRAREKHLKHIEDNDKRDNEIYFEGSVALEEIETIFIEENLYMSELKASIAQWRQQGLLGTIRIVLFEKDNLESAVKENSPLPV